MNFIKNRIYQIKGTEKFWVYIDERFRFETLDGAPCWWEGEIEFIDTGKTKYVWN